MPARFRKNAYRHGGKYIDELRWSDECWNARTWLLKTLPDLTDLTTLPTALEKLRAISQAEDHEGLKGVFQRMYLPRSPEESPEAIELAGRLLAELETADSDAHAGLIIAANKGDLTELKRLVTCLKPADAALAQPAIQDALLAAVCRSRADSVAYLLSQGGELSTAVKLQAWHARTAELWEVLWPYNIFGVREHPEYLSDLLEDSVHTGSHHHGENLSSKPEGLKLARFLISQGAHPNTPSIAQAAECQSVAFMDLLLRHGGSLSDTGALHHAALHGRNDMINYLLDIGVDVNEYCDHDLLGDIREPEPSCGYAVFYACYARKASTVKLLLERGADPYRKVNGGTVFEMERAGEGVRAEEKEAVRKVLDEWMENQAERGAKASL